MSKAMRSTRTAPQQERILPEESGTFTALDVSQRLIQGADPANLLLWPPNLFAFTSYILHLSGAYQLVVSPPPGDRKFYHWPPNATLWESVLDHLNSAEDRSLRDEFTRQLRFADKQLESINEHVDDPYTLWTYLVRKSALKWRAQFERFSKSDWVKYQSHIHNAYISSGPSEAKRVEDQKFVTHRIALLPSTLQTCWKVFFNLYLKGDGRRVPDIATLLCNSNDGHALNGRERRTAWIGAVTLLTMHAIADDTCVGWGILENRQRLEVDFPSLLDLETMQITSSENHDSSKSISKASVRDSPAQRMAAEYLKEHGTMATIATVRARILPKRHNPDVGITLRSLSSNLAFHRSPIGIKWTRDSNSPLARRLAKRSANRSRPQTFTILLLPFPMQVHTRDFRPMEARKADQALENRDGYKFFEYREASGSTSADEIMSVVDAAFSEENAVDMIVLPECALNDDSRRKLGQLLQTENLKRAQSTEDVRQDPVSIFIAGVSERPDRSNGSRFQLDNTVHYGYWNKTDFTSDKQHKHHRWQLSRSQIEQYGLTQMLDVKDKWWEAINVARRHVSFINIGDSLTICPLICEDLARQDPIADLLRHVGPSFVVTILMDGPQHKDRWSSRYASILSEDPGSAVLALSSFGMVRRWNTPFGRLSRVVALWNDKTGAREIELESGARGILLTVNLEEDFEAIADSRLEMCRTSKLVLSDVVQIYASEAGPIAAKRSNSSSKTRATRVKVS